MAVVKASIMWSGIDNDILQLFVEPMPAAWIVDPDDTGLLAVFREVDHVEQETGRIAGIEIIDFLDFDRWGDLPQIDILWQLPGQEPLPLGDFLKREQLRLRRKQAKGVA